MATKNDKVILDLKKEIDKKKKNLAKVSKFTPITNCSLNMHGKRYNLHALYSKDDLGYLIGTMKSIINGFNEEYENDNLVWEGFPVEDWIRDLKARYDYLNVSLEKSRLSDLEKKLHNLLSIDKKVEIEIDDLKSQI